MADEVSVNPGPTPGQVQVEHSLQPLAGEIAKVHRRSTRGRVEGGTGSSKMTFPFLYTRRPPLIRRYYYPPPY